MKTYLEKTGMQLIKEIRSSTGESDEWVADKIDVEQSTVSRIRRGDVKDTSSEIWKRLVRLHMRSLRRKRAVRNRA